jgi:hypothetical protein
VSVFQARRGIVGQSALPPPVLGKRFNLQPVKGSVRIKLPGPGQRFVALQQARQVPINSIVDARKGTARLFTASTTPGKTLSGDFAAGQFQVRQSAKRSQKGLTEMRLNGSSFKNCTARGAAVVAARKTRRKVRGLRGNAKGRFRTRGRYSSATVRGTRWTTTDRCDGTLTSVQSGKVDVRDFRRHKTIHLRTGKRYLAKAPG